MKYTYIIIEDQKASLVNLKNALQDKTSYIFEGYATNIKQGLALILDKQPDVIFLDVELGDESGFDLIQEMKNAFIEVPPIIMTTAHDSYAKAAVNNQISYFLSKPICPVELATGLQIFEKKFAQHKSQIFIRTPHGLEKVGYDDIIYLKADEGYTSVYLSDGKKITVPKTLKHFETKLNQDFLRTHRSYIVNIRKIKEIRLTERTIILNDNLNSYHVEIGKNQVQKLRNHLKI